MPLTSSSFRGASGFKKFAKDLEKLGPKTKTRTIPTMLDLVASKILNFAKERVPVRTGALRASGRIEDTGSLTRRTVAFGGAGTQVFYAAVVEFGRTAFAPMPPQPYLRPAVIKTMRIVKPELKKSLTDSLKYMNKRYGSGGI